MIYDSQEIKKHLLENNRDYNNQLAWRNAFANNDLAAQKATQAVDVNYGNLVNNAYSSFLDNKTAIDNSNIVGAGFGNLNESNLSTLNSAYDTYSQNRAKSSDTIEEARLKSEAGINTALTTQADNIRKYADSHFGYLESMYDKYELGENAIFQEQGWSKYLRDEVGEDGVATGAKRLASKDELMRDFYDTENNLTIKGLDFFDQMQHQAAQQGSGTSFNKYLADSDAELYEWSQSYNPYDHTQDIYGNSTNLGSFKTMFGMAADDSEYTFAERFGGLNSGEIKNMYKDFENVTNEIAKFDTETDTHKIVEKVKTASSNVFKLTEELGIDKELEAVGFNEESLGKIIEEAERVSKTGGQIDSEYFIKMLTAAGVGAAGGAAAGAAIGGKIAAPTMLLPGVGTAVGAGAAIGSTVIGAIFGLVTGIIAAKGTADAELANQKATNKAQSEAVKKSYDNMVNVLVEYSLNKQRQAEIDFNNR